MDWLGNLAGIVAQEGQPMSWITPLGLPVIQPYRKGKHLIVTTLMQRMQLSDESDEIPVMVARQKSAFPPNFVHSLDSSHMLLTAVEMDKFGLPFAAVHDSFWAHASHVDSMNATLRHAFINLHKGPLLEDLRDSLVQRFPGVEFPPVPQKGELKVECVGDSPYFFS